MSKHTINGFLFMSYEYTPDYSNREWRPDFWPCKADENEGRIFIREHAIEVEIADDWDPLPQQVATLQAAKAEALAKYQATVADINERLSKLQALTHDPEVA